MRGTCWGEGALLWCFSMTLPLRDQDCHLVLTSGNMLQAQGPYPHVAGQQTHHASMVGVKGKKAFRALLALRLPGTQDESVKSEQSKARPMPGSSRNLKSSGNLE